MRNTLLILSLLFLSFLGSTQNKHQINAVDGGVSGAVKEWNSQVSLKNIPLDHAVSTAIVYPFDGSVFPADFSPASFMWKTSTTGIKRWNIKFETNGQLITKTTDTTYFKPDLFLWEELKKLSKQQTIVFTVKSDDKKESSHIEMRFSKDSVVSPIFYRSVDLPFRQADKFRDKLEWYLGDLTTNRKRKMLDNMPVCANCHSFTRDGATFGMDVDYANDKGNYTITSIEKESAIIPADIMSWSAYKREDHKTTFGFLAKLSPDGKYAISTVKDRAIFVPVDNNFWYSQLFFPVKGILVSWNKKTEEFKPLKGADDPAFVQSAAEWEPHNKDIVFSRAKCSVDTSVDKSTSIVMDLKYAADYFNGKKDFKFDLYRIPWNDGSGGKAVPLVESAKNNKSNYFARYSPDGKWIVFCQAKNFMLLQPDSRLYIMPSKGGEPRLMNCNREEMNSWHSFSPNGKWLVYSSKYFGPYTQLFLTHIDENGNDTQPVWLEQLTVDNKAANIPEFVNIKYDETWFSIHDGFTLTETYLSDLVKANVKSENYEEAYRLAEEQIKSDPNDYFGYYTRATVSVTRASKDKKFRINNYQVSTDINKAIDLLKGVLAKDNKDVKALSYMGASYLFVKQDQKALDYCNQAIAVDQNNVLALQILSSVYNFRNDAENTILTNKKLYGLTKITNYMNICAQIHLVRGLLQDAIDDASIVLAQDPCNFWAHETTGDCYSAMKDFEKAEVQYNAMISCGPTEGKNYISRGKYFLNQKQYDKAIKDLSKSIDLDGADQTTLFLRGNAYLATNNIDKALADLIGAAGQGGNDDTYFLLAKCYFEKKEYSKALESAKAAKEMIFNSKKFGPDSFKNLSDVNKIIDDCEVKLK